MEEWKNIKNFEGLYQVSNFGRVKSLKRDVNYKDGRIRHQKEKTSTGFIRNTGYLYVNLNKNSKVIKKNIHRLVAQAFIPNPENKPQVNHKDGNKTNNHVDNLEWNTAKENFNHALNTGLIKPLKGKKHNNSKITEKDVLKIRELSKTGLKHQEIGNQFGISRSVVCRICNYKSWTHVE